MTQPVVTKIKNGRLTLPKQLRRKYNNAKVIFVLGPEDSFLMKPIETGPSWDELVPKLKKIGKQISDKDIENAVAWARKKVYQGRS